MALLSRVAFTTYWMSRYAERAENVARFIDVNLHLMLDMPLEEEQQWAPLVTVTGDWELFRERYGEPTHENVVEFLTFDPDYPNSIFSCLRQARENARTVREVISSELWQQINRTYLSLAAQSARANAHATPHDFFTEVKTACALFKGLSDATMSHDETWQFIRLGRMLERADKTTRILDVKYFMLLPQADYVGTPFDNIQWAAVLKSASALEMYRIQYGRISPSNVAEFLILNAEFPRAIHYAIKGAEDCLRAISGTAPGTYRNLAERRLGKMRSDLSYTDINEILQTGLHEYLDEVQLNLNSIGDAIHQTFFAMRPTAPDPHAPTLNNAPATHTRL